MRIWYGYTGGASPTRRIRLVILCGLLCLVVLAGCARERPSSRPPVHLNPNMDNQEKYLPQSQSAFFADGATMRTPVPGTVARGELRADDAYYRGLGPDGKFITAMPVDVTGRLMAHGRERYDVYCSPCHSRVGDGRGIMIQRGYVPPPSFHDDRIRTMPDGQLFDVITHGVRNMPAYAHQVPVADRWAIVSYLRALQRSARATEQDVPMEIRDKVRQGTQ